MSTSLLSILGPKTGIALEETVWQKGLRTSYAAAARITPITPATTTIADVIITTP